MPGSPTSETSSPAQDLTSAVLAASRALISVAVRSIAAVDDEITLPQYRALVLLGSRGSQNIGGLADELGIHPSTATRLCDRLAAKDLVTRDASPESRREVTVALTPAGQSVLRAVISRRRKEIRRIVDRLEPAAQRRLIAAFAAFAEAAEEVPDDSWRLGWTT
jgi:DNA-binding MarR family transcriptional regulator